MKKTPQHPVMYPTVNKNNLVKGVWIGFGVYISDPKHISLLYKNGFFGKGILSRSKPCFTQRLKSKRKYHVYPKTETSQRKVRENKGFHRKRTREFNPVVPLISVQKEGNNCSTRQKQKHRQFYPPFSEVLAAVNTTCATKCSFSQLPISHLTHPINPKVLYSSDVKQDDTRKNTNDTRKDTRILIPSDNTIVLSDWKVNHLSPEREVLQLSLEEAFFLVYAIGVLDVFSPSTLTSPDDTNYMQQTKDFDECNTDYLQPMDIHRCFQAFASTSENFILSYVVYHHFRSLGWVPRSGLKYGVEWVLYRHGPASYHAEWGVRVIPLPHNKNTTTLPSWALLNNINRVSEQVSKGLLLCYVGVPAGPPMVEYLSSCVVHEVAYHRWLAQRDRNT